MRAPPPVTPPPPHDPGEPHLPVDLLAVLGPDELKRRPAHRTAPLARIHIDDALIGFQMRIVPPPVTRPARPLPPPARAAGPAAALPAGPPEGEPPPFSDDEPNNNPLSVVTLSCSPATCPASSATRPASPAFCARSSATSASACPARARQ